MIKTHKLNFDLSREVYEKCKSALTVKECYNNVFNTISFYPEKFRDDWKVTYGYCTALDNLLARHCFIVNEKGEAIDPTIFTRSESSIEGSKDKLFVSHTIFEFDDYIEALGKEEGQPALYDYFRKKEMNIAQPWANKNGYILVG